jgi:hypothetical protein
MYPEYYSFGNYPSVGYVVSWSSYMTAITHNVGRDASDREERWRDQEYEFEAWVFSKGV